MIKAWKSTTLGEISERITKGTTPTSVGFKFLDEGVNFVKVETLTKEGNFIEDKLAHIDDTCHEVLKRSQLKTGDILFSIAGALGRTAMVIPAILPANTNQALAIIRLKQSVDILPEFVLLSLSSGMLLKQIEKQRGGVAQQNLSLTQVKNFELPLPPLPEQKRIVAILDEAFAGISKAVANAEKNLANARELFESYLNNVFTQKGEGWVETTLGCEINLLTGFAFKSKRYTDSPDGVRLLRGDNIVQDAFRWVNVKNWSSDDVDAYSQYYLEEDDVVIAMDRTWVKAGLKYAQISRADLPCLLVQRVARLRVKEGLDSNFLKYLIGGFEFTRYILSIQTGTGVPHISGPQIRSFNFLKPPISVQKDISAKLGKLVHQTEHLQTIYQEKLKSLSELKQSILQKAFAGELTADTVQQQVNV